MGKKNKKEKKGQGKEKTQQKMEKKANKRTKKELAEKGEDDIERMIAEFQEQDKKKTQVIEEKCGPPSQRCNMSLSSHPDKEELIMFGGEYFTGNKMYMYNDLLFYNIKKNEWLKVSAPNAPPPRSSHQAVALRQDGGQLWIFGGEFASPTQSQFYHYKELWVYQIRDRKWQKVSAPGGPSARSGHRMVECKKKLIVFGGFHDNIRDYKYYNDVYSFDLETYTWSQIVPSGIPPLPRSGCVMASIPDQGKILVYGGYSKERVKRDVDVGKIHTDMFYLAPEGKAKTETQPQKYKWVSVRQSGAKPSSRSGLSLATVPGNKALCFGGVFDEEENDEQIKSKFYNNMYMQELDKGKWYDVELRGKRTVEKKKKRRRKKEDGDVEEGSEEEYSDVEEMEVGEEEIKRLNIDEDSPGAAGDSVITTGDTMETVSMETETSPSSKDAEEDSIFKVTIGPQSSTVSGVNSDGACVGEAKDVFMPPPRMNCALVVKGSHVYLYGGMFEDGDRQYTLSDFYSLDIQKMDEWNILIESDLKSQVWEGSDSSSDEEEMGVDEARGEDSESVSDSDDEMDIDFSDAPERSGSEPIKDYFERCKDYWVSKAKEYSDSEGMALSDRKLEKLAKEMCQEAFT